MCFYRDGNQATCWSAESCRDRGPLRAWFGDGAMWSLKSQPGLVYSWTTREQMRSNSLLLCGDAALAGWSGIYCRFLPLIKPPQLIFSSFLIVELTPNFHTWFYGVPPHPPPLHQAKLIIHLFCEAVSPQQEHWRFNFHKRLSCLLHHLNFEGVWSWNLCRFFPSLCPKHQFEERCSEASAAMNLISTLWEWSRGRELQRQQGTAWWASAWTPNLGHSACS